MDLYAYSNIENLSGFLEKNGIEVPRLRGLRWMKDEPPVSKDEMEDLIRRHEVYVAKDKLSECYPGCYEFSPRTKRLRRKYLRYDPVPWEYNGEFGTDWEPGGIRWDRLHGKRRKDIRFAIKKMRRAVERNIEVWNRYAGRPDVLYIHAKIGGGNWVDYGGPEIVKQPWFLEKVDDQWDCTYCDIYAKVEVPEVSS